MLLWHIEAGGFGFLQAAEEKIFYFILENTAAFWFSN